MAFYCLELICGGTLRYMLLNEIWPSAIVGAGSFWNCQSK